MTNQTDGVSAMSTEFDSAAAMREEIEALRAENAAWRKQCDTLLHQVLCCGVAASHPDAALTTRGAYAGRWNSAQAESVRKLRADRDALLAALSNHQIGGE
jgi:hypothetical protein